MQTGTRIIPLLVEMMAWFKFTVVFMYLLKMFVHERSSVAGAAVLERGDLRRRNSHGCAVWPRLMCSTLTLYAHLVDGPTLSVQCEQGDMN